MNLLLIDDDEVSIFIHRKILKSTGKFAIQSAINGKKGLEILEQGLKGAITIPDIILLDLNMPEMNGFEFIEAFNGKEFEHKDLVTIVILTSSISFADKERAASLGIRNFLQKPLTVQALEAILGPVQKKLKEIPVA